MKTRAKQLGVPVGRGYHVHGALLLYCMVALLLSIGAFNSNNNLLFLLFSLSLSLILVSGLISGAMLMGVRVEREGVPDCQSGGPITVRYRIWNVNRWVPAFALTITETAGASKPDGQSGGEPPPARGGFDRELSTFASYVPAGRSVTVEGATMADRRGLVRLNDILVMSEFPFGIVRKSVRFEQAAEVVIRPREETFADQAPASGERGISGDEGAQRRTGEGDQFFALREYHPGDSPRLISWRATARLGAGHLGGGADLLVRQTTATRPRRVTVFLDLAPARSEAEHESAIARAAGAASSASASGALVGLCVRLRGEAEARRAVEPRGGRWHAARVMNDLALLPEFADGAGGGGGGGGAGPVPATTQGQQWLVIRAGEGGAGGGA